MPSKRDYEQIDWTATTATIRRITGVIALTCVLLVAGTGSATAADTDINNTRAVSAADVPADTGSQPSQQRLPTTAGPAAAAGVVAGIVIAAGMFVIEYE